MKFLFSILVGVTISWTAFAGPPEVCLSGGPCLRGQRNSVGEIEALIVDPAKPFTFTSSQQVELERMWKKGIFSPDDSQVAQLILELFPLEESIDPSLLDFRPQGDFAQQLMGSWNLICHLVGEYQEGFYKANGKERSLRVKVGARSSRCRGRCGPGCERIYSWRRSTYTQECLNHDVCHNQEGVQLGVCSHEWKRAAAGT